MTKKQILHELLTIREYTYFIQGECYTAELLTDLINKLK